MDANPKVYWAGTDIGVLFGVSGATVSAWLARYHPNRSAAEIAKAPTCPQPDIVLGVARPNAGWDPAREGEWRDWYASRPGPGAGGGRPRKEPTPIS